MPSGDGVFDTLQRLAAKSYATAADHEARGGHRDDGGIEATRQRNEEREQAERAAGAMAEANERASRQATVEHEARAAHAKTTAAAYVFAQSAPTGASQRPASTEEYIEHARLRGG